MSVRHLDFLFKPESVAIVGASNQPNSIGGIVMRNLLRAGFSGPIMPVHPKYEAVRGVLSYADVAGLPVTPDLAVVCTPPATVPGIIRDLGERGTRAAIVITAGLSRERTDDGRTIQEAMLAAGRPHLLRILGPNCVGLIVPGLALNASFAHADLQPGRIAFVSQSGAFCTAVLDWARARGIGFSHFISLGDSADVDFGDVLDYLGSAPETTAILLYMESIGADEARKFMSAARAAARNKPVLAVKAGRFAEGARAAASHTGALAGSDNVYDAALRRAGILRVTEMDELFDAVETLARVRPVTGDRLAILTNGGGPGVIAADSLAAAGGRLAEFSAETMRRLDELLPPTWSHGNPIDMVGDADGARYAATLEILLEDAGTDAILVMNAPSAVALSEDAARAIIPLAQRAARPILTSWLGADAAGRARRLFSEANVPTYETPESAVRAFLHIVRYRRNQDILTQAPPSLPTDFSPRTADAQQVIAAALASGRELLTEPEAKSVLAAYGIPVVQTRVAADPDQAARLAAEIGFPVVLKILSPDITHKSDVGGVALGLQTAEAVRETAAKMHSRIRSRFAEARLDGFAVQAMAHRPDALELIVGMSTDSIFGPVILFGRGGTAVEIIADRNVELPPLNLSLARRLIERTRVYRRLRGYRDRPPADLDAMSLTLVQVSQLIVDRPEIAELDVNPLLADDRGVLALDARIRVAPPRLTGAARLAIRPYPGHLEQTIRLNDGRDVLLRPIRPEDLAAHAEFVRALSPDDLRFRFLHVTRDVPPSEMARLTQIDYDREMAFIAVTPAGNGESRTLGVARTVTDPDNVSADFALMVRPDMRRTGLGRALLRKTLDYAGARGTQQVVAHVLTENLAMIHLARQFGFEVRPLTGGQRVELRMKL